ncbi:hypothetical protein [Nocardiopsis ansamitocini]|uniref:Uncharacterized protein n=1 Tax=Nocardiopsis ansamitocini TaxID=1670832 RepID=A0A9W6P4Y9_9ACTN|nr:hypothetical protein [Nocardiopsis ansamitocini]GLU47187.1 hypothetical protein Nans01_15380 [Nocardiopsis ansamitocini]
MPSSDHVSFAHRHPWRLGVLIGVVSGILFGLIAFLWIDKGPLTAVSIGVFFGVWMTLCFALLNGASLSRRDPPFKHPRN